MSDKYLKKASKSRQQSACRRKRVFLTPAHASVVGKKENKRPYRCPECKAYHLTSRKFKELTNRPRARSE